MIEKPMNIKTPSPQQWDAFVLQQPRAHFLQLSAWGEQKSAYGWSADRVALFEDETIIAGAQLLFRPLPLHLGTMAYLPYGGYVTDAALWPALLDAVHRLAKQHGAAFLKWEPGFFFDYDPAQWKFQQSPQRVQPPRTVMIDLTGSDDEI
ncbi:MAG: peptidoglycan bridge formation glycyltransferase FemA/FemB family protein, partial [Anaerolineae bacterium]|nr:peptidoglycan bridge formation glycyltransferase FemA/FemB family protein [Anaerolineae bacterium]